MDGGVRIINVNRSDKDGRPMLRNICLTMQKGELVRIAGRTDSGGSVLARLIGGMERPDSGDIVVMGQPLGELDDREAAAFRKEHIGYVSAVPAFWDELTILENTAMPLTIQGMPVEEREAAAAEALGTVGLSYAAHGYPKSLSVNESRLAALARALAAQPELLILEDALSGLSESYAGRFGAILQRCWDRGVFEMLLSFTADIEDEIPATKTLLIERGMIIGERT